jgi:hypothetical protein
MKLAKVGGFALCAILTCATAAWGQTAGQDMKDAGHSTANAARSTGHATKRVARKTARGTRHLAHKTKAGTENLGDRIAGQPATHQ